VRVRGSADCGLNASVAIRLEGVTKTFGTTTAVEGLDLEVPTGALYGFIGPNGAGKTTTIRMLMSILFPDSGRLEVLGHDSALRAKDKIGYLPEERGVYKNMRVGAYLRYIARLKGVAERDIRTRIDELLERVELPDVAGKNCEDLSKGMRQKVQFAAAIINGPQLLILDEPFSGLDPVSMRLLREQIVVEHERGATILFSTHVMPQAEDICDHVVMIHEGRKVLDDPIQSIRGQYDTGTLVVAPLDADADVGSLDGIPGVAGIRQVDGQIELRLADGTAPAEVMQAVTLALPVARMELSRPRLEDIFVRLVAGDATEPAGHGSAATAAASAVAPGADA
jgi:ABC-2 type transport system ATP-binding protein